MMGPWCGTTKTAVLTVVVAAPVDERTVIVYGFSRIGTLITLLAAFRNSTVVQTSGGGFPQPVSFSCQRSVTSYPTTVTPQPTCAPRPISAPGMPGNDPPATFSPLASLAVIVERWNSGGYCSERCGSFATIANPVAECAPSTTQLFEPASPRIVPKVSRSPVIIALM